jgi:hypothetical protein
VTAFDQQYDFKSVMHYGMFDFAQDKSVYTIKPKPSYEDRKIGQREWLSQIDIKKINLMYSCENKAVITTSTPKPRMYEMKC